jgi:hypothetical protein
MAFPALDVDFHLAPFVDPRDHIGAAHARVEISAPFSKPRAFWVRPVRWSNCSTWGNLLMRPVEAEKSRLLLGLYAFKISDRSVRDETAGLELPQNWEEGFQNGSLHPISQLPFAHFTRYWRHEKIPAAVCFSATDDQGIWALTANNELEGSWSRHYTEPLCLSPDELIDWATSDFHGYMSHQFDEKQSQLRLTWEWFRLSPEERLEIFFGRAEWKKFLVVMTWVLESEAVNVRAIAEWGAQWNFLSKHGKVKLGYSRPNTIQSTSRLTEWGAAICAHFEALGRESPIRASIGLRSFYSLRANCEPLSHHDILEARLRLNEWARENLASDEARRLIEME